MLDFEEEDSVVLVWVFRGFCLHHQFTITPRESGGGVKQNL